MSEEKTTNVIKRLFWKYAIEDRYEFVALGPLQFDQAVRELLAWAKAVDAQKPTPSPVQS